MGLPAMDHLVMVQADNLAQAQATRGSTFVTISPLKTSCKSFHAAILELPRTLQFSSTRTLLASGPITYFRLLFEAAIDIGI
jgi:hypothetical protein